MIMNLKQNTYMRYSIAKLYLLTLMLLFSCKEVNRELENETILNNTKTNSEELVEEPIQEQEQINYEAPTPTYDEKCSECGKELYIPKNRKCSWCSNYFDGWSPNEIYENEKQPLGGIVCSDIESEAVARFFPNYHNGKQWRTYSNCYCSNKCYNEAENQ